VGGLAEQLGSVVGLGSDLELSDSFVDGAFASPLSVSGAADFVTYRSSLGTMLSCSALLVVIVLLELLGSLLAHHLSSALVITFVRFLLFSLSSSSIA
jgi:hypothetical protein